MQDKDYRQDGTVSDLYIYIFLNKKLKSFRFTQNRLSIELTE